MMTATGGRSAPQTAHRPSLRTLGSVSLRSAGSLERVLTPGNATSRERSSSAASALPASSSRSGRAISDASSRPRRAPSADSADRNRMTVAAGRRCEPASAARRRRASSRDGAIIASRTCRAERDRGGSGRGSRRVGGTLVAGDSRPSLFLGSSRPADTRIAGLAPLPVSARGALGGPAYPGATRLLITVSMMPYALASSAVMK